MSNNPKWNIKEVLSDAGNKAKGHIMGVAERLNNSGNLFRQRGNVYKDNYLHLGKILNAMFPDGIILNNEIMFNRMAMLIMIITKCGRYANTLHLEGHRDSMDDIAVYSQMINHFDDIKQHEYEQALNDPQAVVIDEKHMQQQLDQKETILQSQRDEIIRREDRIIELEALINQLRGETDETVYAPKPDLETPPPTPEPKPARRGTRKKVAK